MVELVTFFKQVGGEEIVGAKGVGRASVITMEISVLRRHASGNDRFNVYTSSNCGRIYESLG